MGFDPFNPNQGGNSQGALTKGIFTGGTLIVTGNPIAGVTAIASGLIESSFAGSQVKAQKALDSRRINEIRLAVEEQLQTNAEATGRLISMQAAAFGAAGVELTGSASEVVNQSVDDQAEEASRIIRRRDKLIAEIMAAARRRHRKRKKRRSFNRAVFGPVYGNLINELES